MLILTGVVLIPPYRTDIYNRTDSTTFEVSHFLPFQHSYPFNIHHPKIPQNEQGGPISLSHLIPGLKLNQVTT